MKPSAIAAVLPLGSLALAPGASALAASPARQAQPRQIPVVAASRIVGRPVVAEQGEDAGRIQPLIVNTQTGRVDYAPIASRGVPSVPANTGHLTDHVRAHALAQLHRDFGEAPYWQGGQRQYAAAGGRLVAPHRCAIRNTGGHHGHHP